MKSASYYRMSVEEMVKYMAKLEKENYEMKSKFRKANDQIKTQGLVIESLKSERKDSDYADLMESVKEVKSLVARIENKYCGDGATV